MFQPAGPATQEEKEALLKEKGLGQHEPRLRHRAPSAPSRPSWMASPDSAERRELLAAAEALELEVAGAASVPSQPRAYLSTADIDVR